MAEILLDEQAYLHNLKQLSKIAGDCSKVILVFKNNAYGHGFLEIATKAKEFGITFVSVKKRSEAKQIENYFEKILILSHICDGSEDDNFIYAINDMHNMKKIKDGAKIHLAVDTLMHRNGIKMEELEEAFQLAKRKNLKLLGIFTHFRSADEFGNDFFIQRDNFSIVKEKSRKLAKNYGFENIEFHSQASAATERILKNDNDYIRIGIAQFGYSQHEDNPLNLKKVLSLYADKMSSRTLKAGQKVGYGAQFQAPYDMKIATYDLGYADGLFRYDGKEKLLLANGEVLLGRMSMDSFASLDKGERICVFNNAKIFAKFFKTTEYEILVKLASDIKRTWF